MARRDPWPSALINTSRSRPGEGASSANGMDRLSYQRFEEVCCVDIFRILVVETHVASIAATRRCLGVVSYLLGGLSTMF
jgi:hypothetical protein